MKKDRFRRLAAMALAAATLWISAAAVGSDSLREAASAVRDSARLPETLLRWELGDMMPADTLALPALLALRESPLLLSAWAEVAALPEETPPAEETPTAPSAVTPAPVPEDTAPAHEDNGAASQTIAPSSPSGFVQVGDVFIKNSSTKSLEPSWFDGSFAAELSGDAPQVLIIHTHGSEAYTMPKGQEYVSTGTCRTADASVNMIRVGDEIAAALSSYGISVLHDRVLYDDPAYDGAYERAADAIRGYLEKYPTLSFVLDVHRDAIGDAEGNQYKVISEIDGVGTSAQMTLVMGSDGSGLAHEHWMENLKLAVALQDNILQSYPTLMRPILLRNSRYNQHATTGSLLVEVGAAGNSPEEAALAGRLFAQQMADYLIDLGK